MECGIKYSNLRNIFTHNVFAGINADQVRGVVQRCQRDAGINCFDNRIVDEDRICKVFAAVYDTMTDSINFGHGLDNAPFLINQDVDYGTDRISMILHRNICLILIFLLRVGMGQTTVNTDSFTQALGKDFLGIHVKQLILERRTARVDDKNIHFSHSPLFITLQEYRQHSTINLSSILFYTTL